jgi:hypothetical protein
MSNYIYLGVDRDGCERGGTLPGQATPVVWAETFHKRRWRSLTIKYEGEQVAGICLNDRGHRTYWGETSPRVRTGIARTT